MTAFPQHAAPRPRSAPTGRGPVPVVLISGFLGAGKTTLLNHLLSQCDGRSVVALVNDFGAINLDAELVVHVDGDVLKLSNGCVCCNIRGDLIRASLRALKQVERPNLLIVETSGVSDAMAVANSFLLPELREVLAVSAILGLVDAAHFADLGGEMAALAHAQLSAADIVVINKIDLVGTDALAGIRTIIHRIVPDARIVETFHGGMPAELVFDETISPRRETPGKRRFGYGASHHSLASYHWECAQPLSLTKLRDAFDGLSSRVYRAKGIVHLDDVPEHRVLLQMVGRRSSITSMGGWGVETPSSRILLIGERPAFDAAEVCALLETSVAREHEEISPLKKLMTTTSAHHSTGSGAHAHPGDAPLHLR